MTREIGAFAIKLVCFSLILFGIHYYIVLQFFSGELYFPLWAIYSFHATSVLVVYVVLSYYADKKPNATFKLFLGLTVLKMVLAIVFLLPLFLGKSNYTQLEVFNFFIPYFLFLTLETFGLNHLLRKS